MFVLEPNNYLYLNVCNLLNALLKLYPATFQAFKQNGLRRLMETLYLL